ncbi:hypothetical protein BC830DRAFT_201620 [Chytriomyces sp. MP71]|nr:hypothetical protein BC830DRAFT_201620 [Chytriomyces sp. MP71]
MYHMETNADILQNCVAPAAEEEEIIELNHSTAILVNSPIHTDPSHTMAQPSHSVIPRYQHPSLLNNQPKPQQHQHQHQPHHIPFQGPSVHQSVQPFPAPRNSYPFHMPAPMLPFPTPSMPNPAATIDKQASGTQNPIPSQAHPHDDDATLRPPGIDAETFPHMTLPPAPAPHFVTPAGTEPSPPPRENTPLAPRTPPSARPAGTGPVRVLRAAAAMEEFTRSMAPTPEARVPTPRRDRSGGRGCEEEERGNIEGRQSAATPSRSRVGMREVFDGQGREDAAILADVVEPVRKSMRKEATDMKVTATLTRVCADHEDGRCVCKNGTLAVKSIGGGKGSGRIVIYDDDTDEKVLNLRLDECVKVVTSESFNVRLCVVKPDHELEDTVSDDASKQKTGQVVRVIYVIQVRVWVVMLVCWRGDCVVL